MSAELDGAAWWPVLDDARRHAAACREWDRHVDDALKVAS